MSNCVLFSMFSFHVSTTFSFFFFNDTATTEIYTLSLHDALPISRRILGEVADIESPRFRIEGEHDLVCDFYFLHRPLFAQIRRALRPGGLFVAAIHVHTAPGEQGRFLLEPGELHALFSDWEIVHSREGHAAESDHRHA